ncbi:MAG: hypothetical protein V2A72_03030 [Candidatus Omnitrophota bacterium]
MSIINDALNKAGNYKKDDQTTDSQQKEQNNDLENKVIPAKPQKMPLQKPDQQPEHKLKKNYFVFAVIAVILLSLSAGSYYLLTNYNTQASDFISKAIVKIKTLIPPKIQEQVKAKVKSISQKKASTQAKPAKEPPADRASSLPTVQPVLFKTTKSELILSGISYSENGSIAVINDVLCKEGEIIEGAKIVKIGINEVRVERDSEEIILKVK